MMFFQEQILIGTLKIAETLSPVIRKGCRVAQCSHLRSSCLPLKKPVPDVVLNVFCV